MHQTKNNCPSGFASLLMEEGGPHPRAGKKSDQAHPPIHPIKAGQALNGKLFLLYELQNNFFCM